jgi:hypothetical protein
LFISRYKILFYLLLYGCLLPFHVSAEQVVSGRVAQMSESEYEFQISPDNRISDGIQEKTPIVVRLSKRYFQELGNGTPVFPASVRPKSRVKVWGEWKTLEKKVFLAWKIEACPGHDCMDPTGIRSRLRRLLHLKIADEKIPGSSVGSGGNVSGGGPGSSGGAGGSGGAGSGGGGGAGGSGGGGGAGGGGGGGGPGGGK